MMNSGRECPMNGTGGLSDDTMDSELINGRFGSKRRQRKEQGKEYRLDTA